MGGIASAMGRTQEHVTLSHGKEQTKHMIFTQRPRLLRCVTRAAHSTWFLYLLLLCLMATPAAAQPDYADDCYEPIMGLVAVLASSGCYIIDFAGTLIGLLMGISSVLWLVMRNDAAVEPKWSWM